MKYANEIIKKNALYLNQRGVKLPTFEQMKILEPAQTKKLSKGEESQC